MIYLYCQVCECERVFSWIGARGNRARCMKCEHIRILTDEQIEILKEPATIEYPLYSHQDKCPTARYVGGVSKYLCECKDTQRCAGVQAVAQEEGKHGK